MGLIRTSTSHSARRSHCPVPGRPCSESQALPSPFSSPCPPPLQFLTKNHLTASHLEQRTAGDMMQIGTRRRGMETCGMPGIWQLSASSVTDEPLILHQPSQGPHTFTEPISAADRVPMGSGPLRAGHTTGQGVGCSSKGPELTFCALTHSKVHQILSIFLFCTLGDFKFFHSFLYKCFNFSNNIKISTNS